MSFQEKYPITSRYLTAGSKRRSGKLIAPEVKFIVAHDTGNPQSTASGNVRYYENSRNEMSASAHLFVDDREILECIPALTATPEKAWHVLYGLSTDNNLYGYNANDAAIGVEYCYGTNINPDESYSRYVWLMAYICQRFGLDPRTKIVGHFFLDPQRKTDPVTGLAHSRRTYEQLLRDVVTEFVACGGELPALPSSLKRGVVTATMRLNIREGAASTRVNVAYVVRAGTKLTYVARKTDGEPVNGNALWYKLEDGNYCWSGGVV